MLDTFAMFIFGGGGASLHTTSSGWLEADVVKSVWDSTAGTLSPEGWLGLRVKTLGGGTFWSTVIC